jgi:dipeptidyl aminopeptidase/acylaminoacyl peptidase
MGFRPTCGTLRPHPPKKEFHLFSTARRPFLTTLRLLASLLLLAAFSLAQDALAQDATPRSAVPPAPAPAAAAAAQAGGNSDIILKRIDDLLWYQKLGDIAEIDKDEYTGPPNEHVKNKKAPGAADPILLHCYTFIPKNLDRSRKQPLIVFVHQGVHASLDTTIDAHLIRELIQQGYSVVATDYRGSTGYGTGFYQNIDYGGREVDDVYLGMKFMLERYSFLDPKRVGIVGWSHGGLITLMNIFAHPHDFAAAYAGVPVSDLVARMGYEPDTYRELYSAPYHLGEDVHDDIAEYRKRSPVTHAKELDTPLLIHTNTNDEDVNYLEVEHLIQALKAEGKKFDYKVYENAPGGHYFNRMDTPLALQSRKEVYEFLAKYLHPDHPPS